MTRRSAIVVALTLVLSGTWATWFWWRLPSRLPTDDDYRRAQDFIAGKVQPGDVIVLAPSWAERGREFLTAVPVEAGYDLANMELPGVRRVWLVALAKAPRFELEQARSALARKGPSIEYIEIGALWVELFDAPGPKVDFRLTDKLESATVSILGPRGETCRNVGRGRHQCSHADWNHVAAGWHEVAERPLRCIWAHPVDEGPLEIRFPDVPLKGSLHVRAAFTDSAPGYARGAPVELALRSGDTELQTLRVENRPGVQPFDVPLPPWLERGELAFAVSTPNSAMRHFCFDAWIGP